MGYKCIKGISTGNSKMGAIANEALAPILGCIKGVPCAKECYKEIFGITGGVV
jgi:hypothetical protein